MGVTWGRSPRDRTAACPRCCRRSRRRAAGGRYRATYVRPPRQAASPRPTVTRPMHAAAARPCTPGNTHATRAQCRRTRSANVIGFHEEADVCVVRAEERKDRATAVAARRNEVERERRRSPAPRLRRQRHRMSPLGWRTMTRPATAAAMSPKVLYEPRTSVRASHGSAVRGPQTRRTSTGINIVNTSTMTNSPVYALMRVEYTMWAVVTANIAPRSAATHRLDPMRRNARNNSGGPITANANVGPTNPRYPSRPKMCDHTITSVEKPNWVCPTVTRFPSDAFEAPTAIQASSKKNPSDGRCRRKRSACERERHADGCVDRQRDRWRPGAARLGVGPHSVVVSGDVVAGRRRQPGLRYRLCGTPPSARSPRRSAPRQRASPASSYHHAERTVFILRRFAVVDVDDRRGTLTGVDNRVELVHELVREQRRSCVDRERLRPIEHGRGAVRTRSPAFDDLGGRTDVVAPSHDAPRCGDEALEAPPGEEPHVVAVEDAAPVVVEASERRPAAAGTSARSSGRSR